MRPSTACASLAAVLLAVAALSGCGGSPGGATATSACSGNEVRAGPTACGLNARGHLQQHCVAGVWADTATCADPDVCADATTRASATACGLNGRGHLQDLCTTGAWVATSTCVDPDVCTDGATRASATACGLNGRGHRQESCTAGAWAAAICVDPDVCTDGALRTGPTPCALGQGGIRQACTTGAWGDVAGVCVMPATCALGCGPAQRCDAGQCVQVGPVLATGGPVEGGPITLANGGWPMPVAGKSRVYLSATETIGGQVQVVTSAFSADLSTRLWSAGEGVGTPIAGSRGGLVAPAPGFPDDELFVTLSGYASGGVAGNTLVARRADTGAVAWTLPGVAAYGGILSAGVVGGVPILSWLTATCCTSQVTWVRTDGTGLRSFDVGTAASCPNGNVYTQVMGTRYLFPTCTLSNSGPIAVDPLAAGGAGAVMAVQPHANMSNASIYSLVWRAPGSAADTVVVQTGNWTYADAFPDSGAPPTPVAAVNSPSSAYQVPLMDAGGVVWVPIYSSGLRLRGYQLPALTLVADALLVSSTNAIVTGPINLAADGTFVMSTGGKLLGFGPIPGDASGSLVVPPAWTYDPGLATPFLATMPGHAPSGAIVALQTSPGGATAPAALFDPLGTSLVPPDFAWTALGDPAARYSVAPPAGGCTSDVSCGATQRCVLGSCVGTCRTADQCGVAPVDGCSVAFCGPCVGDQSCRAGERCNAGACLACSGAGCCSTNLDCSVGDACVQARCRTVPTDQAASAWSAAGVNVGTYNGATGGYWSTSAQGSDGTTYVLTTGGTVQGYRPNGALVSTSAATTGLTAGTPLLLVEGLQVSAAAGGTIASDVLFTWTSTQLLAVPLDPAATAAGQWVRTPLAAGLAGAPASVAQGLSKALDGVTARPTFFLTSAVQNGAVWALDATAAAAGVATWAWHQATFPWYDTRTATVWNCTGLPSGGLLVGSDGTVYQACREGVVQALGPDGSTPGTPGGLGLLGWISTPAAAWTVGGSARPAIASVPGGPDVLYVPRSGAKALSVLRPAALSPFFTRREVAAQGDTALAVDATGTAVALGHQATYTDWLSVVSPDGQLRYQLQTSSNSYGYSGYDNGCPWALTGDSLFWFVDNNGAQPWLTALQVTQPSAPTRAFLLHGWGNAAFDTTAWLSFVPASLSPETGTAMLVTDQWFPAARHLIGLPAPGVPGLAPWGTFCGDAQHRCSLTVR